MKIKRTKMMGRLSEQPAPVLLKYIYEPRLQADAKLISYFTEVNLAHVIMLWKESIITEQDAHALLKTLMAVGERGIEMLEPDAALEGLYYNYERYVIEILGIKVGGKLHVGRSRNDLGATISRMQVRHLVLDLLDQILVFRRSLLKRATQHVDTVITGYTHLQPAQPITLGHYLMAIEQALQRDTIRLFHTFNNVNRSCLGAGALAGTGFPVNRQLTADLLGFDGFIENTLDAVGSRDYLLELLSNLAILAVTLSRLSQDLYIWYSYEFNLVSFPDRLAGTSSIMPQKKNPVVLESSKGRLAHVIGALVSALSAMKNTNYTNVIDVNHESFHSMNDSCYQVRAVLELLGALIDNLELQEERALAMTLENFSTVTQLADTLVIKRGYSFRDAHHVVAIVVREAIENGMAADQITSAFIDKIAAEKFGTLLDLTEEDVRGALDPLNNVKVRSHKGGPAPETVSKAITEANQLLRTDRLRLDAVRRDLKQAKASLRSITMEIIGESRSFGEEEK